MRWWLNREKVNCRGMVKPSPTPPLVSIATANVVRFKGGEFVIREGEAFFLRALGDLCGEKSLCSQCPLW